MGHIFKNSNKMGKDYNVGKKIKYIKPLKKILNFFF